MEDSTKRSKSPASSSVYIVTFTKYLEADEASKIGVPCEMDTPLAFTTEEAAKRYLCGKLAECIASRANRDTGPFSVYTSAGLEELFDCNKYTHKLTLKPSAATSLQDLTDSMEHYNWRPNGVDFQWGWQLTCAEVDAE